MFRLSIIGALSLFLVACGGSGDPYGSSDSNKLFVNTNQQSVGLCTHLLAASQEDYEFSLNNGYTAGKCTTANTIARCDLSAVNNGTEMEVYYYAHSSFGHDTYQQGCEHLGGTYIQGAVGDSSTEIEPDNSETVDIDEVPLITTNTLATEYQNYTTDLGRTLRAEVWNIKENKFQRFTNDIAPGGLYSYGSFDSTTYGYKLSVYRSEDEGSGSALFGFNHSTGEYKQITNTRWSDDSVCIEYRFEIGIFIGGKEQPDSNCWESSTYGFYIDPYMDSQASPIAIEVVDDIVNGLVKPIMDLDGRLKAFFNQNDGRVYISNGASNFESFTVNAELSSAEPINYLAEDKILFRVGNFVYKYSLNELKNGSSGTDITDSFTSSGAISRIYFMSVGGENVYHTVVTFNDSTNEHKYIKVSDSGDFTTIASIETEFGSSLLSTTSYYVAAAYDENVDRYNEFSVDPRPTASFKYFDKITGLENVNKAFSADINGSGCMVQGDNEFAIVHDNNVSFVNDDATLSTYVSSHLFIMYDAKKGLYGDGTASFIVNNFETDYTQYLKTGSYLGDIEISSGGSLYGCHYGSGLYIDTSFFAHTSQMSPDKFLFGDLTGDLRVY